jgi:ribosome-associated heat shock protein Hsp15
LAGPGAKPDPSAQPKLRLDKWLWQARFFKSRELAVEMVERGHLRLNGQKCRKPGHAVQGGDVLTFAQGARIRVIRVREIGARRGPSSEAQALFDDLDAATTPEDAGNGDDWSRSCRLNDPPGFANQSAVTPALFSKDEMP